LTYLNVATAHEITDGRGVVVGLPDTGVDVRDPDLAGLVSDGTSMGGYGDPRRDSIGHGTAMAGLIGGRGHGPNHSAGVLGIAPGVSILSVQTLFGDLGAPRDLGKGIIWAVEHGAKVICIAGGSGEDETVLQGIREALQRDVVIVAAVGNKPERETVAFPALYPGVLAVGGINRDGNHAAISATGPEMAISAPAVDIMSTDAYRKYATFQGTSNAAAIVTGAAALVRAKYPNLSAPEVIHRLTATATDKGAPGRDPEYGYGVLNIVKALTADVPPAAASVSPAPRSTQAATPNKANSLPLAVPVSVGASILVAIVLIAAYRRRKG
jgi:type VII secretion-associated serine protease mycosin